jgi:hypothetical protein
LSPKKTGGKKEEGKQAGKKGNEIRKVSSVATVEN